jgi:pimeloyl-ACP methyl ester carboxylesterase
MTTRFLDFRQSRVHYRVSGHGPHLTVCLHGFGEYAKTFDPLAAALPNQTLVAIDMPWHGETIWREGMDLNVGDWIALIRAIPEIGERNFGLIGYSMGGRISLSMLEQIPEAISYLVLIAPDGLKINRWYWLATQTRAGNQLFRYTMEHPQWFLKLLAAGRRVKLVNESILKFVRIYVDNDNMRQAVYRVWTTMRRFHPSLPKVKALILQHRIPVYLIFGKYDRIIPPSNGHGFISGLGTLAIMQILDVGHQILHPHNLPAIEEALDFCTTNMSAQS